MEYAKHARIRAVERCITENMILEAISHPSQTYYDLTTGTTTVFKRLEIKIKIVTTFIASNTQEVTSKELEGRRWVKVKWMSSTIGNQTYYT